MLTGLDLFLPAQPAIALTIIWILVIGCFFSGKIDISGAMGGGILSSVIYFGSGWNTLSLLATLFLLGTLATHWKFQWKVSNDLAQPGGGKRGLMHVMANGGVAGTCGIIGWIMPEIAFMAKSMAAASLAAALSDTVSSELGNVYGSRFFNILTFKKDNRGSDGVISVEGTLFGFLGSAVIAVQYGLLIDASINVIWVFAGGILGNLLDSILGASAQRQGFINNMEVNIFNTLFGGICFAILFMANFYLTQ